MPPLLSSASRGDVRSILHGLRTAIRVSPRPANRPALSCLCSPPACSAMSGERLTAERGGGEGRKASRLDRGNDRGSVLWESMIQGASRGAGERLAAPRRTRQQSAHTHTPSIALRRGRTTCTQRRRRVEGGGRSAVHLWQNPQKTRSVVTLRTSSISPYSWASLVSKYLLRLKSWAT